MVPWAAGYSGWFGVVMSGRQPVCSTVAVIAIIVAGGRAEAIFGRPDRVGSMAVTGRQNWKWYLAFMTAIPASAPTVLIIAARRAVWSSPSDLFAGDVTDQPVPLARDVGRVEPRDGRLRRRAHRARVLAHELDFVEVGDPVRARERRRGRGAELVRARGDERVDASGPRDLGRKVGRGQPPGAGTGRLVGERRRGPVRRPAWRPSPARIVMICWAAACPTPMPSAFPAAAISASDDVRAASSGREAGREVVDQRR